MTGRRNFWVRSVPPNLDASPSGWSIVPLMRDYPGVMGRLSVYYSTLEPGRVPHEIHAHPEEEIEVLISGALEVINPDRTVRIGPGSFHFQPPGQPHTIQAVGDEPAKFFLLRWSAWSSEDSDATTAPLLFDAESLAPWEDRPGLQRQQLCAPLTLANGTRLFIFAVYWPEQTGYRVHTDPFDAVITLLKGRLAGFGPDTPAPAVICFPAGAPHGAKPVEDGPSLAIYFQFYTGDAGTPSG